MLTIDKMRFQQDGRDFFFLADTCWSAFTNAELFEFENYCRIRKNQGFTVIQLNLLRQWDASSTQTRRDPFKLVSLDDTNHYIYDYSQLNIAYFDRVEEMLSIMEKYELTPALVLLWDNYVPDTWTEPMNRNNLMDKNQIEPYVTYVAQRYKKFNPIYFISGDTDFPSEATIEYYNIALTTLKKYDDDALVTFHIRGRLDEIPAVFLEASDFFSYQSGHNKEYPEKVYEIPMKLRANGIQLPIINTEPCYEQISYSRHSFGRFTQEDCRRVAWQSILAGASAGITYGAHGIWSWHRTGERFGIVEGEGFDQPYDLNDAMRFPGADDFGYLKQMVATYQLFDVEPIDLILKNTGQIRLGKTNTRIVIYLPVNTRLDIHKLELAKDSFTLKAIDLEKRLEMTVDFTEDSIEMHTGVRDALYIIEKYSPH